MIFGHDHSLALAATSGTLTHFQLHPHWAAPAACCTDDCIFAVYGVMDDTQDNWSAEALSWHTLPAFSPDAGSVDATRAVKLGTFAIPGGVGSGSFGISGEALTRFLNQDRNRRATMVVVRETVLGDWSVVHGFCRKSARRPRAYPRCVSPSLHDAGRPLSKAYLQRAAKSTVVKPGDPIEKSEREQSRFVENPLAIHRGFAHRLLPATPPVSTPSTSEPSPVADQTRWFAEEVHPHDGSLKAYLRGSFPQVRDVDDVVQESYLRIWKAGAGQPPIQCVRAFLFRVARNVAINLLNRERVSPIDAVKDLASLPVVEDGPDAAATASAREELLLLARAIDSLPARCREIVILRRIENVPQREIAARLGIAEATVEVQVVRGVKRCGDYLRRHGVRFDHEARR